MLFFKSQVPDWELNPVLGQTCCARELELEDVLGG
jgi:hypothetical protein